MPHDERKQAPSYLDGYERLYAENPRRAALAWFADAATLRGVGRRLREGGGRIDKAFRM